MSGEFFDEDEIDLTTPQAGDSPVLQQLRKQLRTANRKISTLETENTGLKTSSRATTLKDLVKSAGYSDKIAAIIPADVEPTEAGVKGWLDNFGEIFSKVDADPAPKDPEAQGGATDPPKSPVDQATKDALSRAQGAEATGESPLTLGHDATRKLMADLKADVLSGAKTREQAEVILRSRGLVDG